MKTLFQSDFTKSELTNWEVEQHVPDGYRDFSIKNRKIVFYDAGNRLLPNVPSLSDFIVKGAFDVDWDINGNKFSFQIHFDYDVKKRQGMMIDFTSNGEQITVILYSGAQEIAKSEKKAFVPEKVDFEFKKGEKTVVLTLNGDVFLSHSLKTLEKGGIALSRGVFLGELRMSEFEIQANQSFVTKKLWSDISIPFAPINGMDIPIVWTIDAINLGDDIFRVDVELSGGEKTRPDVPWFPYHGHYVEYLEAPYLRIESDRRTHDLAISDDTLILAQPTRHWFYTFHKEPEWPLMRTFYVRGLCEDSRFFTGYRSYGNRSVNLHQATNRPFETVYDVKTKTIIYSGKALSENALVIDVESPDNKKICEAIPKTIHEYEKALEFAKLNHFFTDTENCRFCLVLTSRLNLETNIAQIRYRIEDAFFSVIDPDAGWIDAEESVSNHSLQFMEKRKTDINLGRLPVGVYHLRYQLYVNGKLAEENYRVFEVNSESTSALDASRFPTLFSMHNEVKACDTDYFDPWKQDCVDVSHYISICNTIMPHFACEKRLWELLPIYKRKWFIFHRRRVMENCDIKENRDLVEKCDFIYYCGAEDVFFRPSSRNFFHKYMLEVLYDYAKKRDFRVAQIKKALEEEKPLDKETFDALVNECYYDFIEYFVEWRMKRAEKLKADIRAITPKAKFSSYGPVAIYATSYKTANTLPFNIALEHGKRTSDIYDGFFVFEDYPHYCKYSINRGPFLLADLKMRSPNMMIYPEMYNNTGAGNPCPDSAVARPFPSYGILTAAEKFSLNASVKRTLEYCYAAVWHNGHSFDYWRDYGFHTRVWERERYEAFLKTWSFIDKHSPKRPMKTNAFISNLKCCVNHKLYYDEYKDETHESAGDLINTAEECIAYAYEMSRNAGQNAGFVADFESLKTLKADDIDTLILPPLTHVNDEDVANIRRLHESGVALLAFEEAAGLEDLFGVREVESKSIYNISVNTTIADNPLMSLKNLTEYIEHRACVGKYKAAGAEILLNGEIPVLFTHQTKWGKTALFNIPPTVVRRQDQPNRVAMGRDSISKLVNESTKLVLKYLSDPVVVADAGKIIGFEDANGAFHVIIEEDAHPLPARTIQPLITFNLPELKPNRIHCDKEFIVVKNSGTATSIRLTLEPDEFTILTIGTA